jgi:hypothetical protein
MRRLSMWRWLPLWRLPLRVRLARLRWLRLRRLRLLLAMGPLPHLLSGTHGGTTTRRFGRLDSHRAGYSFFLPVRGSVSFTGNGSATRVFLLAS